jgi:hypothetical protein
MPDTLVGKSEGVLDRAVGVDDQNVTRTKVLANSAGLKLFCLGLKEKRPCRREVLFKMFGRYATTVNLSANAGMAAVIKVVCNTQLLVIIGQGIYGRAAGSKANGFGNNKLFSAGLLLDDTGAIEDLEKFGAAAIRGRNFGAVYFYNYVVNLQGADRRQTMLDRFYADRAFLEGGSAASFGNVWNNGADLNRFGNIGSNKNHSGIHRSRTKYNFNLFAPEQTFAGESAFTFYGLLKFQDFLSSPTVA